MAGRTKSCYKISGRGKIMYKKKQVLHTLQASLAYPYVFLIMIHIFMYAHIHTLFSTGKLHNNDIWPRHMPLTFKYLTKKLIVLSVVTSSLCALSMNRCSCSAEHFSYEEYKAR